MSIGYKQFLFYCVNYAVKNYKNIIVKRGMLANAVHTISIERICSLGLPELVSQSTRLLICVFFYCFLIFQ